MASESLLNQLRQPFYNSDGTPNERLTSFCSQDVQKIIIDGNTFTGYKTYSFFWEKTFVRQPERSLSGVIDNLNSYSTFITPHLQINFAMMSIEDYRRLYSLIMSKNEFVVTCYNVLTNEMTTNKMYFYPDTLPKLNMMVRQITNNGAREKWIELLGVQDYTIEMVGTNASMDKVSVVYHLNPPSGTSESDQTFANEDIYKNQEFIVGKNSTFQKETFGNKYAFTTWNTKPDGSGVAYIDGNSYFTNESLVLYAQWREFGIYTLSYAYGLGTPRTDDDSGKELTSKWIIYNQPLGTLPNSLEPPSVTYSKNTYSGDNSPYYNGAWYKTATKSSDSVPLTADTPYWLNNNTTIYQLYDVRKYKLTINSVWDSSYPTEATLPYGTVLLLPDPTPSGLAPEKKFKGWYWYEKVDGKQVKTEFNGTMPPFNIEITAEWE